MKRFVAQAGQPAKEVEHPCGPSDKSKLPAGIYKNASITVDSDGKITAIASGEKIIYSAARPCCPDNNEPGQAGELVHFTSSPCIKVTGTGTTSDPYVFDIVEGCIPDVSGVNVDECGTKIENGLIKAYAKPIVKLVSSDGSLTFPNGATPNANCEVDISAGGSIATGATSRLLCQSCGVAIVWVQKQVTDDYVVQGCAWEKAGGTNAQVSYSSGPYPTLSAAQAAMNSATLSCSDPTASVGGP